LDHGYVHHRKVLEQAESPRTLTFSDPSSQIICPLLLTRTRVLCTPRMASISCSPEIFRDLQASKTPMRARHRAPPPSLLPRVLPPACSLEYRWSVLVRYRHLPCHRNRQGPISRQPPPTRTNQPHHSAPLVRLANDQPRRISHPCHSLPTPASRETWNSGNSTTPPPAVTHSNRTSTPRLLLGAISAPRNRSRNTHNRPSPP
jgi:hypothetical protein